MAIVTLRLPEVKAATEKRPGKCPHCGCAILQRWGNVSKPVIDPQVKYALIYRYRCTNCKKTFRDYPQGITQADQSDRMRFVCALFWKTGASLRGTTGLLGIWKPTVCHQTVWPPPGVGVAGHPLGCHAATGQSESTSGGGGRFLLQYQRQASRVDGDDRHGRWPASEGG